MNKDFKKAPCSLKSLTACESLSRYFSELIGKPFTLTGKTRTDGSAIRKLIASVLETHSMPELSEDSQYEITQPKRKGVPKIAREFLDTYVVTTGTSYNLQVWNRMPAANTLLIKYESGESLKCSDVRFVFVRVDLKKNIIASVIILTPQYIEDHFGKFGRPTIKHQLLISRKVRNAIYGSSDKILSFPDSIRLSYHMQHNYQSPKSKMIDEPNVKELFSIQLLTKLIAEKLIGFKLHEAPTKNRGQALEKKILEMLGYERNESDLLYGGFPDIKNQLLEIKVQDSPTVDLGRFSPEKEETVIESLGLTTFDVRYLIALTNPKTEIIEGIIIAPGEKLGEIFSYVSSQNYKCQRSIPMTFFDAFYGKSVFNPM